MRLLLDENLDWRLRRDLSEHQVEWVPLIGWAGVDNGELLRKALEAGFDVLVTMDSNMVREQNIAEHAIAVVALRAGSKGLADTRPLMPPRYRWWNPCIVASCVSDSRTMAVQERL